MKKLLALILITLVMCMSLVACSSDDVTEESTKAESEVETTGEIAEEIAQAEPVDLTGEWTQTDGESDGMYHIATISEDTIEIYWFDTEDNSKMLYWAGTYVAPTTADEPYTWESENNHDKTDSALLASGDDTKTFTYENGQISYEASAMGVTMTMYLEKIE